MSAESASSRPGGARSSWEVAVFAAGIWTFALFARGQMGLAPVSAAGLVVAGIAVYGSLRREFSVRLVLGLARPAFALVLVGAFVGLALSVFYRLKYGLGVLPVVLGWFAPMAMLIGGTEELLFRGFVQGRAARLGRAGAVMAGAFCHAVYKGALFVLPPPGVQVHLAVLVGLTFAVGLAFGWLREAGRSVLPPLIAHVVFDVVAYGGQSAAPWWVWT